MRPMRWIAGSGHPRVCGENGKDLTRVAWQFGPSPRVRGERFIQGWGNRAARRAIPACAGRTDDDDEDAGESSGHPRVCGENAFPIRRSLRRSTGHPRVCGENAVIVTVMPQYSTGHPRVCGENQQLRADAIPVIGPSPRVRGERARRRSSQRRRRAIPACAGRTVSASFKGVTLYGPSPRVRGERFLNFAIPSSLRAIPACAGRTPFRGDWVARTARAIPACAGRTPGRRGCGQP